MFWEKIFRTKPKVIDVFSISQKYVATGQIGAYIKKLYREENFSDIGYRYELGPYTTERYIIYTFSENKEVIQYFKDRCPAMVEKECLALNGEPHYWETDHITNAKFIKKDDPQ